VKFTAEEESVEPGAGAVICASAWPAEVLVGVAVRVAVDVTGLVAVGMDVGVLVAVGAVVAAALVGRIAGVEVATPGPYG
jgi:hypothetical protein